VNPFYDEHFVAEDFHYLACRCWNLARLPYNGIPGSVINGPPSARERSDGTREVDIEGLGVWMLASLAVGTLGP